MRRKDREVTDRETIIEILEGCSCCRLGFYDDGEIYLIPLNFGFESENGRLTLYFHGAKEGRKIGLIEKSPHVGFELDRGHEVYTKGENPIACAHTARFQSIVGTGKVGMVFDLEEKKHGLRLLMQHATKKNVWTFDEKMLNSVAVFKLEVEKLSCKVHE